MHVNDIRVRVEIIAPDVFKDLRAGKHTATVPQEVDEDGIFLGPEHDLLIIHKSAVRKGVDLEVSMGKLCQLVLLAAEEARTLARNSSKAKAWSCSRQLRYQDP